MTAIVLYLLVVVSAAAGLTSLAVLAVRALRDRPLRGPLIALAVCAVAYGGGWIGAALTV
jgi:uncharacterized membrane protein YhaH (DUF805 family)